MIHRERKYLLLAGLTAMIGATLGATGDVLLLYVPTADYLAGDYLFLQNISRQRLLLGSIIGVLFIPLVLAGLWQIYYLLKKGFPKLATTGLLAGIFFGCIGVVVHALFGAMGFAVKDVSFLYYDEVKFMLDLFSGITVVLHALISIIVAAAIFTHQTLFPRWIGILNPLVLYILLFSFYFFWPEVGSILAPAAFNLSYFLFFSFTTWVVYKKVP